MAYQIKNVDGSPYLKDGKPVWASDSVDVQREAGESKGRIITIVGTDETRDRQGDIVMMNGWDLKDFLKNPVFLWAHDYSSVPIAGAEKVQKKIKPKRMVFTEKFPTEGLFPFADLIYELYKIRQINASSVGFIPVDWEDIKDEDDGAPKYWYPKRYLKQVLLELSGCAVPANPSALQEALKQLGPKSQPEKLWKQLSSGVIEPPSDSVIDKVLNEIIPMKAVYEEESDKVQIPVSLPDLTKQADPVEKEETFETVMTVKTDPAPEGLTEGAEEVLEKGVSGSRTLPLAEKEGAWDGAGAKGRLAAWASNDGSGNKEEMDWAKYRRAFCWYDAENADVFGSYKMPFADVIDGSPKAVFKGVVAAMAALNGARGGAGIPDGDRSKVYGLLAHYYRRFDEEPPDMKSFDKLAEEFEQAVMESEKTIQECNDKILTLVSRVRGLAESETQLKKRIESAVKPNDFRPSSYVQLLLRRR